MDIIHGDCLTVMRERFADESVQCVVTSPPYWGLRDYGVDGQLGLESTPEEYVAKMVEVFREVRRVLKNDGVLFLNLGDSYSGSANAGGESSRTCNSPPNARDRNLQTKKGNGLKPKDLVGIPWRVAFALQSDGWYLRSDIIWHKPNPMPESVTDRPTKAHEYLFLMSKSERYYYDAEAIKEPAGGWNGSAFDDERDLYVRPTTGRSPRVKADGTPRNDGKRWNENNGRGFIVGEYRNKRSVWTIATQPYSEAHFAIFPPKLIEPCILAGCPSGGLVLDPFAGSGTTIAVAQQLGRRGVGIELNADYIAMAETRCAQGGLPLVEYREV